MKIVYLLKVLITVVSYMVLAKSSSAQTSVRIFGSPGNVIMELDNEKIQNGSLLSLKKGIHRVKMWAPKYVFLDTTIVVTDKAQAYRLKLPISLVYLKYKEERTSYRKNKIKKLVTPQLLAVGGACGLYMFSRTAFYTPQQSILREAKTNYNVYNYSLDYKAILRAKDRIDELENEYSQKRTTHHLLTSLSVAGGALASYLLIRKYRRNHVLEKPRYNEKPLLSLDNFGLTTDSSGGVRLAINLNIK